MSRQTSEKAKLLFLRNAYIREMVQSSINRRWGIPNWDLLFPWWRKPPEVRILMYADGLVQFSGGSFGGLQYVKNLLESRAYFYVDFDITTAHREGADPTATIPYAVKLTDLDILKNFDEIWLFGYNVSPKLTDKELALLDEFMAMPKDSNVPKSGGVLVTGDHLERGDGLAREIKRAGKMRQWCVAPIGPDRHSTLEEGPQSHLKFDDLVQSDDRPQKITHKLFPIGSPLGFRRDFRPHPVMCGPDGPIDVFPDHQHEGATLEPSITGDADWPIKNCHQEQPYIIACGKTKDPQVNPKEFGIVSAYNGHNVDVGRIVADSSWHHWFDINLLGTNVPFYTGFDATPEGQAALKKIDAYFLNCGVWLAPPDKQEEMRNAAWWSILWTDRIVEIPRSAPTWYLGEQATKALEQHASSCAVTDWVLGSPTFKEEIPKWKLQETFEEFPLFNLPVEQYVAGGILRELMRKVGPFNPKLTFPDEAPPDELLKIVIEKGTQRGLVTLQNQLRRDVKRLSQVINNRFLLQ